MRSDAARNRQKLLTAAAEEFALHGSGATLEAVARRAGVGIGTLYRHFPTRDALVAAAYEAEVEDLRATADALLAEYPADVALVVEVETPATRRFDRFLKPTLYAEAGIAAYWRVEPGRDGPVLRTYELGGARYRLTKSVEGAEPVKLDAPFPVRIAPATWV